MMDPLGRYHPFGSFGIRLLDLLQNLVGGLSRCLLLRRLGVRRFLEDAAHGGGTQMEPGSAEPLGDLELSHGRAEDLQALDKIAGEFRVLVDRRRGLDQRTPCSFPKKGTHSHDKSHAE